MKTKVLRSLWRITLFLFLISLAFHHVPRMFAFYEWIKSYLYSIGLNFLGLVWGLISEAIIILLLLVPAFAKKIDNNNLNLFRMDLIFIVGNCVVDLIGCAVFVPRIPVPTIHKIIPIYSIIMDSLCLFVAVWMLTKRLPGDGEHSLQIKSQAESEKK